MDFTYALHPISSFRRRPLWIDFGFKTDHPNGSEAMKQRLECTQFFIGVGLLVSLVGSAAWAIVPQSAVTSAAFEAYALYFSNDPTCQTGLTAVMPFQSTARTLNFAQNPEMGNADASTVKCTIAILKNAVGPFVVAAGSYGTTHCDAGATIAGGTLCASSGTGTDSLSYPAQVVADAAAAGVTLATTCSGATNNSVVPQYRSTYSRCTGLSSDPASCQVAGAMHPLAAPTGPDSLNGVQFVTPEAGGTVYRIWMDFNDVFGDSGGSCGFIQVPPVGFSKVQ